jgi:molybdate transport system substrate-binding protein
LPKDLTAPQIKRVALGDPRVVPVGVYARNYLEKLGLWKAVEPKVVPTENVRGALAAVEAGNADAGIVYKTDVLVSKRVVIAYAVPSEEGPDIRYPVALVQGAKEQAASRKLLRYLASEPATKVFERRGFIVTRESRRQ